MTNSLLSFGISKGLGAIVAMYLIDYWGRRKSLILGLIIMTISACSLFLLFEIKADILSGYSSLFVLFIDLFVIGYELSVGCVTFVILGEIFPLSIKSEAISIAFVVCFTMAASMTFILYYEIDAFGYVFVWGQFAASSSVFIYIAASLVCY